MNCLGIQLLFKFRSFPTTAYQVTLFMIRKILYKLRIMALYSSPRSKKKLHTEGKVVERQGTSRLPLSVYHLVSTTIASGKIILFAFVKIAPNIYATLQMKIQQCRVFCRHSLHWAMHMSENQPTSSKNTTYSLLDARGVYFKY